MTSTLSYQGYNLAVLVCVYCQGQISGGLFGGDKEELVSGSGKSNGATSNINATHVEISPLLSQLSIHNIT